MKYRYNLMLFPAALLGGIYLSVMYIYPRSGTITLSELILQLTGSGVKFVLGFSYLELAVFAMRLFPAFIFVMYAGIMLYRNFCTAGIYVFSRCPHRVKWYVKEVCHLGAVIGISNVILLASVMLTTAVRFELQTDRAGMVLMAYHFIIQSLWVYIMALSVNLLAIYFGSSTAYGLVISVQLVCIVLLYIMDLLVRNSDGRLLYKNVLIWNPVAHLVLGWHKSNTKITDTVLTSSYMKADLNHSLILFLVIGMIVTSAGAFIIKKRDILVENIETGAV